VKPNRTGTPRCTGIPNQTFSQKTGIQKKFKPKIWWQKLKKIRRIFFSVKNFKKIGKFPAITLISHSSPHTVIRAHSGHFPIEKSELPAIQKPSDSGILRALFPGSLQYGLHLGVHNTLFDRKVQEYLHAEGIQKNV
jgi:hypothetical protein